MELAHERGVTIFISSHILGEVSRLATRLGIIHQGRLIQELGVDELKRIPRGHLMVRTRDCLAALPVLREAGYPAEITQAGAIEVMGTAAIDQPDEIASLLVHAGCAPTMLNVEQEDLEHYFLKLVGAEREVAQ